MFKPARNFGPRIDLHQKIAPIAAAGFLAAPERDGKPALIWIKNGAAEFADVRGYRVSLISDRKLTTPPRPRIRHCLVCGIAMLAGKSRENLVEFDTFECLTCHTVIREAKPRAPADKKR